MTDYYVTKYALSNGGKPLEVQSDEKPDIQGDVFLRLSENSIRSMFRLGRDVFTSEADAKASVIAARDKKIASLEKQIAKLRKIGGAA